MSPGCVPVRSGDVLGIHYDNIGGGAGVVPYAKNSGNLLSCCKLHSGNLSLIVNVPKSAKSLKRGNVLSSPTAGKRRLPALVAEVQPSAGIHRVFESGL